MEYVIEEEQAADFDEIRELIRMAFLDAEHADGDEHEYVDELRRSAGYIPELALTITINSGITGHIMFTKTWLIVNSDKFPALLLSPVCIMAEYRNLGLAGKLIRHGLNKAKDLGYKAVFLVGDPAYYNRFGFMPLNNFGISGPADIPDGYAMALELEENYLSNKGGVVSIV